MNRYFVTGATGFLGSRVVNRLLKEGAKVYCLRRKSSNLRRVQSLANNLIWIDAEEVAYNTFFMENPVDCIYHCATDYGRKTVDPYSMIESNLLLPLKILHNAVAAKVPVFINTDTVLDKRIGPYSLSKHQFSQWLESYSREIVGINVATQHFYGPGDDETKFTTYIVNSLLDGAASIPLTKGEQCRDFIYVDDVVEAMLKIMTVSSGLDVGYHEYEVGSGCSISIKDFVQTAKIKCQNKNTMLDFGALPYRDGEVMNVITNTDKLKNLNWQPKFSLEEGLNTMISEMRGCK